MLDVGHGAVPLQLQFPAASIQAVIQVVEVLLGLGDQAVEPLGRLALDLPVEQIAELHLLAVDQGVEADFDVLDDPLDLLESVGRRLVHPGLERSLIEELLDGLTVRHARAVIRRGCAHGSRDDLVQHGRLADGHLTGGVGLNGEQPAGGACCPGRP